MSWFRRPYTGIYDKVYEWQGGNFSECGPAALATVVNQLRHDKVDRFQCRNLQPLPSWWRAVDFLEPAKALSIHLELGNATLARSAGIYLNTYWGFGHWVVAWLRPDGQVQVLDPKRGTYTTTTNIFMRGLKSRTYLATDAIFR